MTTKKIYLAGPIAGLSHQEATYGWREFVYDRLHGAHDSMNGARVNIHCYNPMRGKKFLASVMGTNPLGKTVTGYHKQPIATAKAIVGRDRDDVRTSDLIIMNLAGAKAVSIGTTTELGWADAFRIPILLIKGTDWDSNPHNHLFFDEIATWAVETPEEAVHIAKQHLLPYLD